MVWTSLFGIVTLVLLAWALGFAKAPELTGAAEARQRAADAIPGFRAADVAVARDRRAALVAGIDGRVALLRPVGDRWVVRVVNGAEAAIDGGRLRLAFTEPMFPAVVLDLGAAAPAWAARL